MAVGFSTITRDSWAEWLAQDSWDFFGTWTFKYADDPTLPQLRRAVQNLSDATHPARLAWFSERGKIGGRGHLHGLIALHPGDPLTGRDLWNWWFRRYGRCKIEPFDPELGAAGYCAKYLTKDSFDYDYLTNPHPLALWQPSKK